jgi:hypothetical protein
MSLLYTELCCSDDLDHFPLSDRCEASLQPPEMQFGCMSSNGILHSLKSHKHEPHCFSLCTSCFVVGLSEGAVLQRSA